MGSNCCREEGVTVQEQVSDVVVGNVTSEVVDLPEQALEIGGKRDAKTFSQPHPSLLAGTQRPTKWVTRSKSMPDAPPAEMGTVSVATLPPQAVKSKEKKSKVPGLTFLMTIRRTDGGLGLNLKHRGNELVVNSVFQGGAVDLECTRIKAKGSDNYLQPGDVIFRVNDVEGNSDLLVSACKCLDTCLHVRRPE